MSERVALGTILEETLTELLPAEYLVTYSIWV